MEFIKTVYDNQGADHAPGTARKLGELYKKHKKSAAKVFDEAMCLMKLK